MTVCGSLFTRIWIRGYRNRLERGAAFSPLTLRSCFVRNTPAMKVADRMFNNVLQAGVSEEDLAHIISLRQT